MVLISSKCTISIRHGSNFGPTWAHLAQISAQLGSNMAQLGPGSNFAPSLSPHALKMGAHGRPITKTLKHGYSLVRSVFSLDDACVEQCSQCCVSGGPNLVWSCRQSLPNCGMLGFHAHHIASIWGPTWPTWAPVGSKIAPKLGLFRGSPCPSWAQPGQFCTLTAARWKLAFLPLFPTFFGFGGGSCWAMLPTSVLHPTSAPDAPTQDQVAHVKPNLRPKRAQVVPCWIPCWTAVGLKLGPSWSQLAWVRRKLRPSWAQIGSCCPHGLLFQNRSWMSIPARRWFRCLLSPVPLGCSHVTCYKWMWEAAINNYHGWGWSFQPKWWWLGGWLVALAPPPAGRLWELRSAELWRKHPASSSSRTPTAQGQNFWDDCLVSQK